MFELFIVLSKKLFFQEDEKGNVLFQHFLLGPIFILATLSIALLKYYLSPVWHEKWTLGFAFSLFLGLLISLLSFFEATLLLAKKKKEERQREESLLSLQNELKETQEHAEREKERARDRVKMAQQLIREREKKAHSFEALAMQKKYEWERLEEEKEALFQEKVSAYQEAQTLLEQLKELGPLKEQHSKLIEENRRLTKQVAQKEKHHPYEEMRKQFEEKSHLLNETRKQLFQLESKWFAIQKEHEENAFEPTEEVESLISHLKEVEVYSQTLEEENKVLHEIVAHLSVKKPPPKRKKAEKKVKVSEAVVADLFTKKPKVKN